MTAQFDDLLSALCSQFEPQHVNDFQKLFLIPDAKEAKLAFDVLVAYGFDAKVYHDAGKGSKLYLTPPAMDANTERRLTQALAYAKSLHEIKNSLDNLSHDPALNAPDYTMTFANAPGNQKQVNIVLTQAVAPAAMMNTPAPPRPAVKPALSNNAMAKKKVTGKKKEEDFSSGPTLGKHYYPGKLDDKAQADQASLKRQVLLYMSGNAATGGTVVLFVIVVLAVLFTFFVLAKSFLCPDFATAKKNVEWYCRSGEE